MNLVCLAYILITKPSAKRKAHVLKELFLEVLPTQTYYGWMEKQGKMGGQHKFPRVLRGQARLDFIWSNR